MSEGLNTGPKVVMDFPKSARGPRGQKIDPAVAAAFAQAQATQQLAQAITGLTVAVQPAVDAVHSLSTAQQKFCGFLVRNRLKIALSIPTVAVAVLGISPNAAALLGDLLKVALAAH